MAPGPARARSRAANFGGDPMQHDPIVYPRYLGGVHPSSSLGQRLHAYLALQRQPRAIDDPELLRRHRHVAHLRQLVETSHDPHEVFATQRELAEAEPALERDEATASARDRELAEECLRLG